MPQTGGPAIVDPAQLANQQVMDILNQGNQARQDNANFGTPSITGSGKKGVDVSIIDDESYIVGPGLKDVDVKPKTCPAGQQLDASGNCVPIVNPPPPPPPPRNCEPGYEKNAAGECVPVVVAPPPPRRLFRPRSPSPQWALPSRSRWRWIRPSALRMSCNCILKGRQRPICLTFPRISF